MTSLSGKTLLIVDDEALIRDAIAYDFSKLGCKILEADGGNTALDMLLSHRIDVVISDIIMPDGDGIKLLEKMLGYPDRDKPIVIMITGGATLTKEEASKKGVNAIVSKPFRPHELLNTVISQFDRVNGPPI